MVILYLKKTSYSVALMLKGIIQAHLPYRKKLAESTRANRFSVWCAVFELCIDCKKNFFEVWFESSRLFKTMRTLGNMDRKQ
jgi:hypothetical protein